MPRVARPNGQMTPGMSAAELAMTEKMAQFSDDAFKKLERQVATMQNPIGLSKILFNLESVLEKRLKRKQSGVAVSEMSPEEAKASVIAYLQSLPPVDFDEIVCAVADSRADSPPE